jgi:Tol biopolymer transport system component
VANLDGTQARRVSAAGSSGFGEQWSPDGSLLVYQQQPDGSTSHLGNLFVQNMSTGQRTRVTNLDQSKNWGWWFLFPSFSPDGRSVLYQAPRGHSNDNNRLWDLWSVPVTGGKPTLVQRNAGWGAYSPDGKSLAYLSPMRSDFTGAGVWITSLQGGTPRALVRGGQLRWLRWSPDGTRIAYSNGDAIYTVDPATGKTKKVANGGAQPQWIDDHTLVFTSN